MVLPLNTYTQWYWKVDLHNLLHFLRLRHDSHAQYEIRAYAEVLLDIVRKWVPLTAAAFEEYRVGGAELSAGGARGDPPPAGGRGGDPRELRARAPASGASSRRCCPGSPTAERRQASSLPAHSCSSMTKTTGTSRIAK